MAESFSVKAILSAKDSNFSSTMKACSGYAENLKSTLTSGIGFGAMAAIGSKAVSVVGNGLKSLTTGAISAGTNFESAMSSVASISGATGNDLKELTSKAEQMGATTQFSATEAANAMEYMAMAGWKTKDMVSGIGGIMNLAAASGADLARTSDIVTDALTAFGKSASDSGTFADVMAAASSNANTNVEMMGETFKYVGAAAGAMGYSIQDIALATGLMANSGIKGSEAGTALRSVITRMAKPTKESSAAMKKLGLSMTDSKGRMKSFGTIMKDMRKGMKGMTEDQKASYAAMLGGQEAMSGVLAIANASEKDFNKLSKAIDNSKNAAQNMAKVKLDNLKGDVTILQSSMEGLGITIFDQVGGNLRGLVGTATDVVGKINEKLSNGKGIENFIYKMQLLQRKATPYWNALKINGIEAGKALGDAISAIITDISKLTGSFGSTDSIRNFSDMIGTAKDGIVTFSGFLENHSDTVAKVIVLLPKLLLAYKGFKVVGAIAPFMGIFASGILRLGKAGLSKIAPNLFKVAKGQEAAGKASSGSAKKMVASAKAFALMGVGVLTIGAGFYLLAQSAVAVANAGPGAVAVLAVLVGVVTGLTVGMTKMLSTMSGGTKKLSAMTPALLALGASILLASAGMAVLAYSAVQIAQAGPGAAAVLLGMVVALGALLLVAKSVAPAMTAGAAGFVAFGAAVLLAGAGIAVLSLAAISLANAGPVAIGVMVGMVAAVALLGSRSGCSRTGIDSWSGGIYRIWSGNCSGSNWCADRECCTGDCGCGSSDSLTIWSAGSSCHCTAWRGTPCVRCRSGSSRNRRSCTRSRSDYRSGRTCTGWSSGTCCSSWCIGTGSRSGGSGSIPCSSRSRSDIDGSSISTGGSWCDVQRDRFGSFVGSRNRGKCCICSSGRKFRSCSGNGWRICGINDYRSSRNCSYGGCVESCEFQHEVDCGKCKECREIADQHAIQRERSQFRSGCTGKQSKVCN